MESACSAHGGVERKIRCLDSELLGTRIDRLLATLKQRGVDLETHCGRRGCCLAWHSAGLNETLHEAAMQLIEHSPGAFTLSAIQGVNTDLGRTDSSSMDASILLHWLLKNHNCIKRLVLGAEAIPVKCFPALLSEALVANQGLVEIRAHPVHVTESWRKVRECRVLAAALGEILPRLEFLDVTPLIIDHDSVEAIASAVCRGKLRHLVLWTEMSHRVAKKLIFASGASASLCSLEITGSKEFSISSALVLAAVLERNKTLQKLTVKSLKEDVPGIILASLKDNSALSELCLHSSLECLCSTLWDGLQALRSNRGLKFVTLTHMNFRSSVAIVIADILRENNTLQELRISNNLISNTGGRALAQALTQNSSLRRIDVSKNEMIGGALVQYFVNALATNNTLESVHPGAVAISEDCLPACPLEANVHARLHVTWNTSVMESFARHLQNNDRFPRLYVGWTDNAGFSSVVQWFSMACAIGASLTELSIECPERVKPESSAAVVCFLEATVTLKKLVVRPTFVSHTFITDIIRGLTVNKSVCDAEIDQYLYTDQDVKALQSLFRENRTLHRLMFAEYWLPYKAARTLARALEDNFVFLTLEFKYFVASCGVRPFLGVLIRNRSLLNRAVECVLGAVVDSRTEEALQYLSACDSLLDAVADASGRSREESRCMVLEAVRRHNSSSSYPRSSPGEDV